MASINDKTHAGGTDTELSFVELNYSTYQPLGTNKNWEIQLTWLALGDGFVLPPLLIFAAFLCARSASALAFSYSFFFSSSADNQSRAGVPWSIGSAFAGA